MSKKKQEHLVNCENMKPNMKIYKSSACKIATHYCVIFLKQFVLLRKKMNKSSKNLCFTLH